MFEATTILAVADEHGVAMVGDGQVTLGGGIIMKHKARKVRRLYKERILAGFAGSTADALTLFERFEAKLEEYSGNLVRAGVEMAKDWRKDKFLRRLEAMMLAADSENILIISGAGDVMEPDDGMAAIGSGGPYALSAARALKRHTTLPAREIALQSMAIASEICVFTNESLVLEEALQNQSQQL